MGGLIALAFALRNPEYVDALIVSAPAVLPGRVPRLTVAAGRAMSVLAPDLGVIRLP
jgi:alpha-beta hydrolase superfamily lysophospholipase